MALKLGKKKQVLKLWVMLRSSYLQEAIFKAGGPEMIARLAESVLADLQSSNHENNSIQDTLRACMAALENLSFLASSEQKRAIMDAVPGAGLFHQLCQSSTSSCAPDSSVSRRAMKVASEQCKSLVDA